jgi:NAD(P)-dependent dehydrogenase (short-subunit alcohol dehydrogenase family)
MNTAVVVGASGELGSAIATRLAELGHPVVAVARRPEPLAELADRHPRIAPCAADISAEASVRIIAEALAGRPVSLAVQCAAAPGGGGILSVEPEAILAAVDVKVNGLLRLRRAVDAGLGDGSRLVAIGGNLGYDPTPDGSTAGVANAALANAARQLSRALGPRGATCHVIAPGPVDTRRFRRLAAEEAQQRGIDVETVLSEARAAAPLGRLTTPAEVAWAVALLRESEAEVLTGGTLLLDGGRRTAIP